MKTWKLLLCAIVVVLAVSGCRTPGHADGAAQKPPPPPELMQQQTLSEIVRHLYRWYWDEADIERAAEMREWVFWVRPVDVKLDPGDHSLFAEILLPQLGTTVRLKKADYTIEEMKTPVKSQNFRIKSVGRMPLPSQPPEDCEVVKVNMDEMKQYLFRTRNQPDYPDAELFERMRQALRKELEKESAMSTNPPTGEQIVFVAPLSPVGNDVWMFWENPKLLIRFASDIDLSNPAVWEHETLMVHVYDPYQQMVISLDEAAGSKRFLTRNQIGRALYNCIVLGQRATVTPRKP
jgi:hypothetical protein